MLTPDEHQAVLLQRVLPSIQAPAPDQRTLQSESIEPASSLLMLAKAGRVQEPHEMQTWTSSICSAGFSENLRANLRGDAHCGRDDLGRFRSIA